MTGRQSLAKVGRDHSCHLHESRAANRGWRTASGRCRRRGSGWGRPTSQTQSRSPSVVAPAPRSDCKCRPCSWRARPSARSSRRRILHRCRPCTPGQPPARGRREYQEGEGEGERRAGAGQKRLPESRANRQHAVGWLVGSPRPRLCWRRESRESREMDGRGKKRRVIVFPLGLPPPSPLFVLHLASIVGSQHFDRLNFLWDFLRAVFGLSRRRRAGAASSLPGPQEGWK